jgi:transposase
MSRESVRKWRVRFTGRRMDGLGAAPRPGAARKITDEQVEVLVTRTLTEKGRGQDSHWSTPGMAAETGLSQSSVSRIWRAFGLKPHVAQTRKLSTDPEFIGKVRDVVGLYMSPPGERTRAVRGREVADPGKTADEILETLAAYCQRIIDSGHLNVLRQPMVQDVHVHLSARLLLSLPAPAASSGKVLSHTRVIAGVVKVRSTGHWLTSRSPR